MNRVANVPHFWRRIVLAWLGVAVLLTIRNWAAIRAFDMPDADDWLRLVQVRDWLAGQGWFDLRFYRVGPPQGVSSHWSRLVDLPLAGVILALRPWLGQPVAEQAAAVIVPLLTLLCAMLFSALVALRLFGQRAAYGACFVWLSALVALTQLQPLRIDHHGWQIVCQLGALAALFDSHARRGGRMAGLVLAIGLAISFELLPFVALTAGVLALRWLRGPDQRGALCAMASTLAGASVVLYLITRGFGADPHCDVVNPSLLLAMLAGAAVCSGVARVGLHRPWQALGLLAGGGVLALGIYLGLAPQCRSGPFGTLDPLVRTYWYDAVLEGLPVWRQPIDVMVQMLVPPVIALGVTLYAWHKASGDRRIMLGEYAIIMAGAIAVAVQVARYSSVATAIATVPLGHLLAGWLDPRQRMPVLRRLGAMLAAFLILMPGVFVGKVSLAMFGPDARVATPANLAGVKACRQSQSMPMLAKLPPSLLFAPHEIGPTLLAHTPHSVVATGHHRGARQLHDVIAAFSLPPDQAEALVRRQQARYVVICDDLYEASRYRERAPQGLMARLLDRRLPPWLRQVPLGPAAGTLSLWQVLPPRHAADGDGRASARPDPSPLVR